MKTYRLNIKTGLSLLVVFIASCTYDFPAPDPETVPTAGDADFTKYISIGNSLTAGYMDGTIYDRGQQNSFPSILARQFVTVGGGEFVQPDVNSPVGCYDVPNCPLGRLRLVYVNG